MTNSRYQLSFYNQIILFYSPPVETYPYIHFWSLASCYLNHLHINFCITWKNLSLKFFNLCFPFVFKAFCCICDLLIVFAKQLKNRGNLWLVWLHDLFVGAISADPKHVFFTIAMFQPPFWRLWYMKLITPLKWGSEITSSVTCSRTWTRTKQRMKTVRYFKSLRPNIRLHILHTVHYTFPKVLTRRICWTIKSFFSWWSFPLFSWPWCLIQGWYCKEKLVASLS